MLIFKDKEGKEMLIAIAVRFFLTMALYAARMFGVWVVNLFIDALLQMLDDWVMKWVESRQKAVVVSQ